MAIIDFVDDDSPLSQGDLLKDILLHVSKYKYSSYAAGEAAAKICIVLSRPCVAAHKQTIVVASVEKFSPSIPEDAKKSFDHFKKFLEGARGGWNKPDLFYLGELREKDGRFCAKLDSIHTVEIPVSDINVRNEFLKKHRFARLSDSFIKDLHLRFFQAFASLGFDDSDWFCDSDLELLVTIGNDDLVAAAKKDNFKHFEGKSVSTQNAAKEIDQLKAKLKPYESELIRRQAANNPSPPPTTLT